MNLIAAALEQQRERDLASAFKRERQAVPALHVVGAPLPRGKQTPSCLCGTCKKCRNRIDMRNRRRRDARLGRKPARRKGPALDPDRRCVNPDCRGPLAWTNQSGWCAECARKRYMPRTPTKRKRGWFTDGGGI
jgi:hypothetical protein